MKYERERKGSIFRVEVEARKSTRKIFSIELAKLKL